MLIEKRTALIVVAQIAFLRPICKGSSRMPHVMSLFFANGFWRFLAIFDTGPQEAVVSPGVIDFDGQRNSAAEMRRAILERNGNNNVLVGFHAARSVTAFSLPLLACCVWTLARKRPISCSASSSRTRFHCGRRCLWSASPTPLTGACQLFSLGGGIELYTKGQHNLNAEAYYTAAI